MFKGKEILLNSLYQIHINFICALNSLLSISLKCINIYIHIYLSLDHLSNLLLKMYRSSLEIYKMLIIER